MLNDILNGLKKVRLLEWILMILVVWWMVTQGIGLMKWLSEYSLIQELKERGETVTATVRSVEGGGITLKRGRRYRNSINGTKVRVSFEYEVNGKIYHTDAVELHACHYLPYEIGESYPVNYLPENPEKARGCGAVDSDCVGIWVREMQKYLIMGLVFLIVICIGIKKKNAAKAYRPLPEIQGFGNSDSIPFPESTGEPAYRSSQKEGTLPWEEENKKEPWE